MKELKVVICAECSIEFTCKDTKRNQTRRFCSGSCAKRNNGKSNKGRKHTEDWKLNMSERNSGNKNPFFGRQHTEQVKETIGLANKTYPRTPEHCEKIRQRMLATNPFKGKKHTKEAKKRMGRDMLGEKNPMFGRGELLKGERNGSWKGGVSFEDYGESFNESLKTKIRQRDKFTCAVCSKNGFDVHHIDYDKKNNTDGNLITLCRSCHARTNFNRDYWRGYFG